MSSDARSLDVPTFSELLYATDAFGRDVLESDAFGADALEAAFTPLGWAASVPCSSNGASTSRLTPKRMVSGAGSAGGGTAGLDALEIKGSTSGSFSAEAVGKKLGLHHAAAFVGALGVKSNSSALERFRLLLTTLPACDTLLRFSISVPKKCTPGSDVE